MTTPSLAHGETLHMTPKIFRARLKRIDLTMKDFAAMVGYDYSTVSMWGKKRSGEFKTRFPAWVPLLFDAWDVHGLITPIGSPAHTIRVRRTRAGRPPINPPTLKYPTGRGPQEMAEKQAKSRGRRNMEKELVRDYSGWMEAFPRTWRKERQKKESPEPPKKSGKLGAR